MLPPRLSLTTENAQLGQLAEKNHYLAGTIPMAAGA
jgi:hypothetical protein